MANDNSRSDITKWASSDGQFKRQVSSFRDVIEEGGKFQPEAGRYHLYVSLACPWAHRTLIVRKLKGLEDIIDVSVVHPHMLERGWSFETSFPGATGDRLKLGGTHLRDIYHQVQPDYNARYTVPTVYDTKTKTIVNNESSEVIRFLNTGFNSILPAGSDKQALDLYPDHLKAQIDEINTWIYNDVNNGVYKSGFATTQEAYEKNVRPLFAALDRLEQILEGGKLYLVGDQLTEADVRLFTTIIRFDPVYVGHFKCNLGTIRHSFPNLNNWLKNLYWKNDAFKSTTDFDHIKEHYYYSHVQINPTRIVPVGPVPHIEPL
ncbi:Predicted glutathione S-transferase [Phaffia rhodozyma]|uniref:Glutathione S-transferase omega-like 2 n=1 Tax=Phaffia rhodozyma TaxID=264483 RepID=A0A0F7SL59_PHARH|nr:Predicted glutathione S-transferase [Phaffia rhodozyma]